MRICNRNRALFRVIVLFALVGFLTSSGSPQKTVMSQSPGNSSASVFTARRWSPLATEQQPEPEVQVASPAGVDADDETSVDLSSSFAVGDNERLVLPAAIEPGISGCPVGMAEDTPFCADVVTGTLRAVYRISNPTGISTFPDVTLTNFEQSVIASGPSYIDVEILSRLWLDTAAPYPVNAGTLPSSVTPYLLPTYSVQSDHPSIRALAVELVNGSRLQAEAAERVLTWIRSHINYDYSFSYPNDAISVLANRTGVCAGFANLAAALLRAAEIPAKVVTGCATPFGYGTGTAGGWHAWVAVYYPDAGWVMSEPQSTANYFRPHALVPPDGGSYFGWCGASQTTIEQPQYENKEVRRFTLATSYESGLTAWGAISVASVPAWERSLVSASPTNLSMLMKASSLPVERGGPSILDDGCASPTGWSLTSDQEWLTFADVMVPGGIPTEFHGSGDGRPLMLIDLSELGVGEHYATLRLTWYWYSLLFGSEWREQQESLDIPVVVKVVPELHTIYLPVVCRQ